MLVVVEEGMWLTLVGGEVGSDVDGGGRVVGGGQSGKVGGGGGG